ncbi:MAG: hypothetical protein OEZ39_12345 [Gammaproteobacteria bacterium]|nr:hypothetical protein [Gammaproteobacteria bacterium]
MKIIWISLLALFIAIFFIKTGFYLTAGVVNGNYLTLIGVMTGVVISTLHLFIRWKNTPVFNFCTSQSWYEKPPHAFFIYYFNIFLWMWLVTALNNYLPVFAEYEDTYKVVEKGGFSMRGGYIYTVRLENLNNNVTYSLGTENNTKIEIGDTVVARMRKGALGFARIIDIEVITNKTNSTGE